MKSIDNEVESNSGALIEFTSYDEAMEILMSIGYLQVSKTPTFLSHDLVDLSNSLLEKNNIKLMDMTSSIPSTVNAVYNALTIAGFTAVSSCKKDNNVAFLIMRTKANTPSFLMGHHWSMVQALGKSAAETTIRNSPTPSAFLIFRDKQFYLPCDICELSALITSRLIAKELSSDNSLFSCCICDETFLTQCIDACIRVPEIGIAPCNHMFHRNCIESYIKHTNSYKCPAC
jgi:hypothetical protein